ncbi:MAG: ParA family protein [Rhodocyclaceae bacterium]|nr:MAG: ParA family protein [Rhodocyclaceae bacterium]
MKPVSALPAINRRITIQQIGAFSDKLLLLMGDIREQMLAPRPRKKAPNFSIGQVAALCGTERQRINYLLAKEDSLLPKGALQGNGKSRLFSLSEAQEWVQAESGITLRPKEKLGEVIVIANFKGGSTKTTTAMSLAQGLSLRGRKVLVLDLDPQASLTELCGMYAEQDVDEDDTILPLIYGDEPDLRYAVKETYWHNLFAIPAATPISAAEFVIPKKVTENRGFPFWRIIGDGLQPLRQEFDYIIADTSPSMSYLTINGLMSANAMVMPLVPESLDFISGTQFWGLFADLCRTFSHLEPTKAFDFVSVLLSKVDNGPTSSAPIIRSWSQRAYGDWLLPMEIPMSSVVGSEALEFATIYDIETWAGSKKTLDRIKDPFDAFVKLVDDEFVNKWSQS